MKRSEASISSTVPHPKSLTPTLDVPMLDPPTLEGALEGPSNVSGSQRKEVSNSRSPFCNELDRIRQKSRQSFVPFRKDQRKLKAELPDFRPILPPIAKTRWNFMPIPNSTRVREDHFHICPRLINTDSVKDPKVDAMMIYVIVLPQDEQGFFGI